jgi:hypothetical protein
MKTNKNADRLRGSRGRSKRVPKAKKEIQLLKEWVTKSIKIEVILSHATGCAISYVGSLSEDSRKDTFCFQTDALAAQVPMPQMRIALDPRSWKSSKVARPYGAPREIRVLKGKGQEQLRIRESFLHKILLKDDEPVNSELLVQLRTWASDQQVLSLCLFQPSHAVFFRCQAFELPEGVFKFSRSAHPDFGLIIFPKDYGYKIEPGASGTRLILESTKDTTAVLVSDTSASLEEVFKDFPGKTTWVQ